MICIYCGKEIDKYTLSSLFLEDDLLCYKCRSLLKTKKKYVGVGSLKVETFYDYDGLFRNVLIQYKECYDEALAPIFLYLLKDYIKYRYHGYKIMLMPSSKAKLEARGFNHLELIYKDVGLEIVQGLKMRNELIQEGKDLSERKLMIDNYIYDGPAIDKVLVCDDVLTSGSSMLGAYKALNNKCKHLKFVSLAYKKKTLSF